MQRPPITMGCGFFQWRDPKMCSRAVDLIPGLMERIEKLEEERLILVERKKKDMKTILVLSLVVFVLIIFHYH